MLPPDLLLVSAGVLGNAGLDSIQLETGEAYAARGRQGWYAEKDEGVVATMGASRTPENLIIRTVPMLR